MVKKDAVTLDNQDQERPATELDQERSTVNTGSEQNPPKNSAKAGGPPSGFYIYIGPTIKSLIRNGTIYRGDRAHALLEAREAIVKYPLIKTLIVSGDYLPVARLKVKTSGNALHANYVKLTEQVKSAAAQN